jgi:hypothetical protein
MKALRSLSIAILLLATFAAAQSYRGSIRGTVTDPSGAVVPNATVTATSVSTAQTRTARSGADGAFVLAELPAGNYTVTVEAPTFSKFTAKVDVAVGLDTTLDARVRVQGSDTVEVNETTAPLVEQTRDVLGQVIENKLVIELPLNGRDFGKLVALTPGVTVEGSGVAGTEKGFGQFNINGNRDRSNNYMLDGTDNNDPFFNNSALNQVGITGAPASLLPIDAIQEFNLQSQYGAEYGRNSGAAVNVLTKSGTNVLHGSVFYFLRNSALDARNYFNFATNPDGSANPKGGFKNNQYGVSLGGPIVKDKTFFFFAYEGQRERVTSNYILDVPSALQISDAQATVIANGVTPNPALTKILNYFPAATGCSAGTGTPSTTGCIGGSGTANGVVNDKNNLDSVIGKFDQQLSSRNQLSARYAFSQGNQAFPLGGIGYGAGSRIAAFAQQSPTRVQVLSASLLTTFSATNLNELRFGYSRYRTSFTSANQTDPSTLGLDMGTGKSGIPEIDFGGLFENLGTSAFSVPRGRVSQTYEALDNFTWIHGKHSVKFGGEYRRAIVNSYNDNLERALMPFYGDGYSTDYGTDIIASFYLGDGFPASLTGNTNRNTFNNNLGFFVQDDYKLSSKLTLNLGMRWEYFGPLGESHGLISNMTASGPALTDHPYNRDLNNFGPRIGMAWNVLKGTVVRAGYGVYYDYVPQSLMIANYTNSAGLVTNPIGPDPVNALSFNSSAWNGSAAGPVYTAGSPPYDWFFVPRNLATPYVQSWNLNIQQELGHAASLEIGYVGSKGTKLTRLYDANQANPDGNRPDPNYGFEDYLATIAGSTYHAFQTTLRLRSLHGFSGFTTYTFSKSLDDASDGIDFNGATAALPQNSLNIAAEHGPSTFDTRHRFTGAINYAVPVWSALPSRAAKGWNANAIVTLQSGRPIPIITSTDTSILPTATGFQPPSNYHQRPDVVPGVNPINSNWNPVTGYLNSNAFAQPADGTFGNLGRDAIYGPHFYDTDFSLTKLTPITERVNLEFRAEFFNIFNHPNFALPNGSYGSGTFGQITQTPDVAQGNPGLGGGGPRVLQFGLRFQF